MAAVGWIIYIEKDRKTYRMVPVGRMWRTLRQPMQIDSAHTRALSTALTGRKRFWKDVSVREAKETEGNAVNHSPDKLGV